MIPSVEAAASFVIQEACWICGSRALHPAADLVFELSEYRKQDPELAAYSGTRMALNRCGSCGFGQPESLPALDRYFDRMYDQRWAPEWIRAEHDCRVKDFIFRGILADLDARVTSGHRRLLDVGTHAGRFVAFARTQGWQAEGLELNPQTAAYAAQRTGARIRQLNAHDLDPASESYDAITMTDVLEHIPNPAAVLRTLAGLLAPGGWLAVKVPSGPAQRIKEQWRGRLVRGYRPTLADNLVHVSHFSPVSLRMALEQAGLTDVTVGPGAPELHDGPGLQASASRALRRALFTASRFPGAVRAPVCLNLQAYGRRRER